MDGRHLPERDSGAIDAEFRDLTEPGPFDPIACPHCGKDAAPCFGMCYHCMQPLVKQKPKGFWATLLGL